MYFSLDDVPKSRKDGQTVNIKKHGKVEQWAFIQSEWKRTGVEYNMEDLQ